MTGDNPTGLKVVGRGGGGGGGAVVVIMWWRWWPQVTHFIPGPPWRYIIETVAMVTPGVWEGGRVGFDGREGEREWEGGRKG